jgi:PAS domain-containing protein
VIVSGDIVERLRSQHNDVRQGAIYSKQEDPAWDATADAAAAIERLRAEMERLRAALEVAADRMSMTGAPQTIVNAMRKAARGE